MHRLEITHELIAKAQNTNSIHGMCTGCQSPAGTLRRQDSSYEDELKNWAVLCPACQTTADHNWQLMWEEYNKSRG
jgi:hypothetical protein